MNSPVTLSHWHTEPALIGGLLFICWCYAIIVGPYRKNFSPNLPYSHRHTLWFSAAIISFYLAVGSPLDAMGENFLFFAHMIQHNILTKVVNNTKLRKANKNVILKAKETLKNTLQKTIDYVTYPA